MQGKWDSQNGGDMFTALVTNYVLIIPSLPESATHAIPLSSSWPN